MVHTRRAILVAAASLPVAGFFPARLMARSSPVYAPTGVALGGYDPVGYFTTGGLVAGRRDMALKWRGAIWQFSDDDSMQSFEMNPFGFAPRFGCYCAWALSQGALLSGDPAQWMIHNGRLFVTHSPEALANWGQDTAANLARAEANWPKILES